MHATRAEGVWRCIFPGGRTREGVEVCFTVAVTRLCEHAESSWLSSVFIRRMAGDMRLFARMTGLHGLPCSQKGPLGALALV